MHFLDQWFWLVFAAIAIYFVFNMFRRGGLKGALFNAEIVGTVGEIEASGPKLIPIGHGGPYATPTSCRLRSNAKSSRSPAKLSITASPSAPSNNAFAKTPPNPPLQNAAAP